MVVRGRQRKRIRRKWPAGLGRLLLAGLLLSLSTQKIAHQDLSDHAGNRVADSGRQALDPTVTGSISAIERINRAPKSDRLAARQPQLITAGALKTVSLFAAPDSDPALPHMAFVLPKAENDAVATSTPAPRR